MVKKDGQIILSLEEAKIITLTFDEYVDDQQKMYAVFKELNELTGYKGCGQFETKQ